MANKIPDSKGLNVPLGDIVIKVQTRATRTARDAAVMKLRAQTYVTLEEFYNRMRSDIEFLSQYAGVKKLIDYANENHDDPEYDVSAAFNGAVAAYQGYVTWYATHVPVDSFIISQQIVNGEIITRPPNTSGLDVVLEAIIATVE